MSGRSRAKKREQRRQTAICNARRDAFYAAADVLNGATQCRLCISALRNYGDKLDLRQPSVAEGEMLRNALMAIMVNDGPGLDGSPAGPCYDIAQRALNYPRV